jgi:hypothetical protein
VEASNELCGGDTNRKISSPLVLKKKKVHYWQDMFFVVIDPEIADALRINQDDDVWVQQSPSNDGIFMKLILNRNVKTN